jgi:NADH-quinone oxidoreductase subunit L
VGVALLGIGLAYLMYIRRSLNPATFAEVMGGWAYKLTYNKYYVDELYQATVIRGTLGLAAVLSWFDKNVVDGVVNGSAVVVRIASRINGLFDAYIIDGLVNLTASVFHGLGGWARKLQTGSINGYLYVIVAVVTVVLFVRAW